jgi:hypothetical protein
MSCTHWISADRLSTLQSSDARGSRRGRDKLQKSGVSGSLSLVDRRARVNLTDVLHDALGHVPLGL